MKLSGLMSIAVYITGFLMTTSLWAQRVAGGAPKPPVAFGYENALAIAKNEKIQHILASSFNDKNTVLQTLNLKGIDAKGYHYRLKSFSNENQICELDITIWNTHTTPINEVKVTALSIISGCKPTKRGNYQNLEDLAVLAKSDSVNSILGLNFSVEKWELVEASKEQKHYKLTADTITAGNPCVLTVLIKNSEVIDATTDSGDKQCKIKETTPPPQSVFKKYNHIFEKFPKNSLIEDISYENYLAVVRTLPPEIRQEIRVYMAISEPEFHKVLSKNTDLLKYFFKKNTSATVGNTLYILYQIMGFPTNTGGIYTPAIIALKLVPFFVID